MTRRRVSVIRNVRANANAVERFAARLAGASFEVLVHTTNTFEEGVAVARECAQAGTEALIAAGGDGTLLSILDAALDAGVVVGGLALGTASDFGVHLGTRSPESLAEAVERTTTRSIDVLECSFEDASRKARSMRFVTTAGVGVLGEVARRERRGVGALFKQGFKNAGWPVLFGMGWRGVRGAKAALRFDDSTEVFAMPIDCFEVCKVRAPGGFTLAPDAEMGSGILHAFYFGGLSIAEFGADLARCLKTPGGHLSSGRVQYLSRDAATNRSNAASARRVSLTFDAPLPVHVQGEFVGTSPVTFSVTDRRLEVFAATPKLG